LRFVLLPGMDGTGDLFGPFLRALPPGAVATVVAYPPDRPLGYGDLRPLVEAAIPAEGPYVLVAESFSGPLGILHAADRPPRLRALVLSATFASNPLPGAVRGIGVLARPSLFRIRPTASFVRSFLAGRDVRPEVLDLLMSVAAKVDPEVMAFRLRQVLDVDVEDALPSIAVPTLYLQASRDRLVGRRAMKRIAARLPGMRTAVLDAHHLLLQTRPEEAVRAIDGFLSA
jgi:pimeloyl-ACP methyl ester carboxylesterase